MSDIDELVDTLPTEKYQTFRLYAIRTNSGQILKDTYRPDYEPGIKKADYSELKNEGLVLIIKAIEKMKYKYIKKLKTMIKPDQIALFYECLSFWVDGKSKREDTKIKGLKKDVLEYLKKEFSTLTEDNIYCIEKVEGYESVGLEYKTLKTIFDLNKELFNEALDLMVKNEDDEYPLGNDDLMLHRGLNIGSENEQDLENKMYREKNFLSSYSLSINVAEKFAVTNYGKKIIVSANLKHFENRILVTSLFSKDLEESQLEFLVTPHWYNLECKLDTKLDGIEEYVLDLPEKYKGYV